MNQLLMGLLLPLLLLQLIDAPGWSNGRDVMTWVKRIFRAYSLRLQEVSTAALLSQPVAQSVTAPAPPVCASGLQQL